MSECIVVNLVGDHATGKSTGAAYIFSRLKMLAIVDDVVAKLNEMKADTE